MTQLDESELLKQRLGQLKNYLFTIKEDIEEKRVHVKPWQHHAVPTKHTAHQNERRLRQQMQIRKNRELKVQMIQKLQKQLDRKKSEIFGCHNSTRNALGQHQGLLGTLVGKYQTRITCNEPLPVLVQLLQPEDWEFSMMYMCSLCLVLVNQASLSVAKINLQKLQAQTMVIHDKYLKFMIVAPFETTYILKFGSEVEAKRWQGFLHKISCNHNIPKDMKDKWDAIFHKTELKDNNCAESDWASKSELSRTNMSGWKSNGLKSTYQNSQGLLAGKNAVKKPERKLSASPKHSQNMRSQTQAPKLYLHESDTSKNNLMRSSILKQNQSFKKEKKTQKSQPKQQPSFIQKCQSVELSHSPKNSPDPPLKRSYQLLLTSKVLEKLEQKQKLLADSLTASLTIHWHQQKFEPLKEADEKSHTQQNFDSIGRQSLNKQIQQTKQIRLFRTKKQGTYMKINELRIRTGSNDSPGRKVALTARGKYTKQDQDEAANQIQERRKRKKTDFSLQHEEIYQTDRKKNKNQIREHYLHRLIEKQLQKEGKKPISREDTRNFDQYDLMPIPEKKTPSVSGYGSMKAESDASLESETETLYQKQSTQLEIQVQELKNGIVLEKCSKDAWSIKEKKLYLSSTMAELCYCDIQNPLEEKKFFLKDILSIEIGKISRGIIKHKKKYDENRCLLIRVKKEGKQKNLQFYLDQSEPVYNLQQFIKKLQNFIDNDSEHEQNSQN